MGKLFCQNLYAGLGHGISGVARRGRDALLRPEIDDRARTAGIDHAGDEQVLGLDNSEEVDVHLPRPERAAIPRTRALRNARVVD